MNRFMKGIQLILTKNPSADYQFEHDIMYIDDVDGYDAYEINELWDLGFYIDNDLNTFVTFS